MYAGVVILAVSKLKKYSLAVFAAAQWPEDLKNVNLLGAAKTKRILHKQVTQHSILRFVQLVNTTDNIFKPKRSPEVKGIKDQLPKPDKLLIDVLSSVNKFSRYLQIGNLVLTTVAQTFTYTIDSLWKLLSVVDSWFVEHDINFFNVSWQCMALAHWFVVTIWAIMKAKLKKSIGWKVSMFW